MNHVLAVVGIGADGLAGLASESRTIVDQAEVLAGGRRHLDFFPSFVGDRIVIAADLESAIHQIKQRFRQRKTVILASGDPLYFGIGCRLLQAFSKDDLVFYPHVSSIQLAFARIKEPWNDARIVSLHGRPIANLLPALHERVARIGILTDGQNHPAAIAEYLVLHDQAGNYAFWVCENLGGVDEQVGQFTALTIRRETFSPLNIVVLVRNPEAEQIDARQKRLIGIPDDQFMHAARGRGMITKCEVRLIALASLELKPDEILWDVGAGSGSVAIESARLSSSLKVYAIEKSPDAFAEMQQNASRIGTSNIHCIHGEAPLVLLQLPDPDAIFVGGSSGKLIEILAESKERLRPGGRIVCNCITIETFSQAWQWLDKNGMAPAATTVQLGRTRPLGNYHSFEPDHMIFVLRARKA